MVHAPYGLEDKPNLRRGEHLDPKEEASHYLYKDSQGKLGVPAVNIKACIRDASRNYKIKGRRATFASLVRAGIEILPFPMIPLGNEEWTVDIRPVVVQRARILRARPKFDEWSLEFELVNREPTMFPSETMKRILEEAGKYYGLGDYRPDFGLFEVERFEIIQK